MPLFEGSSTKVRMEVERLTDIQKMIILMIIIYGENAEERLREPSCYAMRAASIICITDEA